MSTYTYTIPGTTNKFPCFPGIYLLSGATTDNTHIPYPIFKSMPNFSSGVSSLNDTADLLLIMPGYRVQLYGTVDYSNLMIDTSNSTIYPTHEDITNNIASSVKLYYGSHANGWTEIG